MGEPAPVPDPLRREAPPMASRPFKWQQRSSLGQCQPSPPSMRNGRKNHKKIPQSFSLSSSILSHTASHLKTPLAVYSSIHHNQNIKLYSHRKITNDSSYFPYLCYKTFLDHHLHGDQTPPYHIITLRPPQNTSPQPVNTFTSYIFEIFSWNIFPFIIVNQIE